ncbi:MAG: DUF4115 domain-containing protein [Alkalinema sp. RL_2_19]|nr:DUF4115 domain-containing protein [Alkalinema sp. RL_2_19]
MLIAQPKSGQDAGKPTSTETTMAPAPTASTQPSVASSPKLAAPLNLTVKVTDDSWVEVLTDGKVVEEGILPKGTTKTWTAKERLSISTGNAQGISFSYNGSPEKPMGPTANLVTLVFPPQP